MESHDPEELVCGLEDREALPLEERVGALRELYELLLSALDAPDAL
ncbi:MAG: hypothetical protein QMB81_00425 [Pontimonas sp.]